MSQSLPISIPQAEIEALCQRWHITWLALFGSVLRDDFTPDSDVDVLVTFEPGFVLGWDFTEIGFELTDLFGHEVDLNTPDMLSKYFRDEVLAEALTLYVAA